MQETISEIKDQFDFHKTNTGESYAVLKPISDFDSVDFQEVSKILGTTKINSYTMTDKIVIEL